MFFPTSGVTVSLWIPPLVAFGLSFLASMGGVSGAFLLLPFQMSVLGYTHPSVSATNQVFNIVAIPAGVYRYCREGRMVWPLTWAVVVGTLPGVLIGAWVRVQHLRDPRAFKCFAGLVMLFIALRMVRDFFRKRKVVAKTAAFGKAPLSAVYGDPAATVSVLRNSPWNMAFTFQGREFRVKGLGGFILCFVVGIVGGIYGIGGGAIIAPFLITFLGLPVYVVAGASLMGTFVTSVAGVSFYSAIAPFYPHISVAPDWRLGVLFGLGGMVGMYAGARMQKYVPAYLIQWMLVLLLTWTAGKYILDFLR